MMRTAQRASVNVAPDHHRGMILAVGPAGPVEPLGPVKFVVNRPFLLLLRNTVTGTPLFFGRISDPGTRLP